MFVQSGAGQLVRNIDIQGELKKMAESADFTWVQRAAAGPGRSGTRPAAQPASVVVFGRLCDRA